MKSICQRSFNSLILCCAVLCCNVCLSVGGKDSFQVGSVLRVEIPFGHKRSSDFLSALLHSLYRVRLQLMDGWID